MCRYIIKRTIDITCKIMRTANVTCAKCGDLLMSQMPFFETVDITHIIFGESLM